MSLATPIIIPVDAITLKVVSLGPFNSKDVFCTIEIITEDGITTKAANVCLYAGRRDLTVYAPYGITVDKYFLKQYAYALEKYFKEYLDNHYKVEESMWYTIPYSTMTTYQQLEEHLDDYRDVLMNRELVLQDFTDDEVTLIYYPHTSKEGMTKVRAFEEFKNACKEMEETIK